MKLREKALENLKIKGAFGAQELYDKHRGKLALNKLFTGYRAGRKFHCPKAGPMAC